jgi:uncharacterized protein
MGYAHLRCYAELNDHLPAGRKHVMFPCFLEGGSSVNILIESLGVPANEVDLVLVNGVSVGPSFVVADGDCVSVYPVFESLDISSVQKIRPKPLRLPRFVLDVHLGKLAAHLRMLGFDTLYRNDYDDDELLKVSHDQQRSLLTKDRLLLQEKSLTRGYHVREKDPRLQLLEVLQRFDLVKSIKPFTRCIECNSTLCPVGKEVIAYRLPTRVEELYDEFRLCQMCDRVYWKGSHWERMQAFIESVVTDAKKMNDDHQIKLPNNGGGA